MTYHLFRRGGYDTRTVIVQADSELEARGKIQEHTPTGIDSSYQGEISNLCAETENGVLDLNRI